jgi:hypothetical protein
VSAVDDRGGACARDTVDTDRDASRNDAWFKGECSRKRRDVEARHEFASGPEVLCV